jgi:hypothetical protein
MQSNKLFGVRLVAIFSFLLSLEFLSLSWYLIKMPSLASVILLFSVPVCILFLFGGIFISKFKETARALLMATHLTVGSVALFFTIPGVVVGFIDKNLTSQPLLLVAFLDTIIPLSIVVFLTRPTVKEQFK